MILATCCMQTTPQAWHRAATGRKWHPIGSPKLIDWDRVTLGGGPGWTDRRS
jgi:hypothetical protein